MSIAVRRRRDPHRYFDVEDSPEQQLADYIMSAIEDGQPMPLVLSGSWSQETANAVIQALNNDRLFSDTHLAQVEEITVVGELCRKITTTSR